MKFLKKVCNDKLVCYLRKVQRSRPLNYSQLALFAVVLLGAFLRFYKLDWGDGYFFHPDERNIANLAASISPPLGLNFFTKGTFAYGGLLSYLALGIDFFRLIFLHGIFPQDSFTFILLLLRFNSAVFSTLTIFLIHLIGKKFWDKKIGLLAAVLFALSPGTIQAAHFGTFEAILSFLYLLVFFFSLCFFQKNKLKSFFLSILFIAIASAIKINSLIITSLPFLLLLVSQKKKYHWRAKIIVAAAGLSILLLVVLLSPYYLTQNFREMLNYEQQLVRGTLDVFYTRQFFETKPIIFQCLKILPFLTNPLIILCLPFFLVHCLVHLAKKSFRENGSELILLCFLGALFLPNAFLFTKWTRYMVPAVPFLILFVAVFTEKLAKKWRRYVIFCLVPTSIIWGLAFMSVYFHKDVRLVASEWIYQNIEDGSQILSETGNVVDVPLPSKKENPPRHYTVENFDFYNLEGNEMLFRELLSTLEKSDYILIPSRRLFGGMGQFPEKYPLVSRYYQLLFSGGLGFEEVKKFTSYPHLWFLEFPDELAEETWSVFDHPVVRIYQKTTLLTEEDYEKLLQI